MNLTRIWPALRDASLSRENVRIMKLINGMLFVLLILMQYKLWFGESGLHKTHEYQERIEVLNQDLKKIRRQNAVLQAEVDDLRNGLAAVEERARRDLGMIRRNETFFQIIEPTEK